MRNWPNLLAAETSSWEVKFIRNPPTSMPPDDEGPSRKGKYDHNNMNDNNFNARGQDMLVVMKGIKVIRFHFSKL